MTQFQFDMICSIINSGAPALANELIGALSNMVSTANQIAEENAKLKAELERRDADCEEPCKCEGKCSSCDDKACEAVEG